MGATLFSAAVAFALGFALGFRSRARYCHISREQARSFKSRSGRGLINGVVFGSIAAVLAYVVFGPGLATGAG